MKIGTKSLLFGVHQFLWHPVTVTLAWRFVHGRWPRGVAEWCAIVAHDWGYWGCADMDGPAGKQHPLVGAEMAADLAWKIGHLFGLTTMQSVRASGAAYKLVEGHSVGFLRSNGVSEQAVSDLYLPDKVSVLFDPRPLYLLRAILTGEVWEYMQHSPFKHHSRTLKNACLWLEDYRRITLQRVIGL